MIYVDVVCSWSFYVYQSTLKSQIKMDFIFIERAVYKMSGQRLVEFWNKNSNICNFMNTSALRSYYHIIIT